LSEQEDADDDALSAALDRLTVQLFNSEEVGHVTFGACNMLFSTGGVGKGGCCC
jgi:hypothetical protein